MDLTLKIKIVNKQRIQLKLIYDKIEIAAKYKGLRVLIFLKNKKRS